MKSFYKSLMLAALAVMFAGAVNAQSDRTENLWTKISADRVSQNSLAYRSSMPAQAFYYQLDLSAMKNILADAPSREQLTGKSNVVISFPVANGGFEKFRVIESSIMHPALAAKYPFIKTYAAQGIDDPTATMRFSITQRGLHSMTLSGKHSTNYIDPYTTDGTICIVYDKESLPANAHPFECTTDESNFLPSLRGGPSTPNNTDDKKFRTYRLALCCNAEYGNIFAIHVGTEKADIMAQMVITMTRVNGVYERDLSVTMQFIANDDLVLYYGSTAADPWSGEFNTKTAQTLDAVIGVANYDIGHNFNTSGGGNAGCIGCVCLATSQSGTHKGRGMTGSANPTGDAFDIDYVAHEMGHQFGGYHTMNTCSRSGNGTSEVEPGSGSSVMGYAGICGAEDVQPHSDDDFTWVNVDEISGTLRTVETCAVITALTDNPPTANAGSDYTIPKGTVFVLEGTGNDVDGNGSLTYNWMQNDPAQGAAPPASTGTAGPLSRAIRPQVSPNRYIPNLTTILANLTANTWEVTPTVGRTMNFSFIVRDNDVLGGQTASDLMKVTVDGASGPFVVTSQPTAVTWNAGTTQNITWNVAGTTAAPVSCANVNILLSTDGGLTYPIILASNVPNNGSAIINVPNNPTTTGRLMVRGAGNIFFDLNNGVITIQVAEFIMNYTSTVAGICPPANAVYNFTYNTFLGFNETTVFSASGLPAGATATFNPTSATTDGTPVTLTISGLTGAMVGGYNITVTGTATTVTKTSNVTLNVLDPALPAATLLTPANGAIDVSSNVTLTWAAGSAGTLYDVDVATDAAFTTIVASTTGLITNSYSPAGLTSSTTYYWRVQAHNTCTTAAFSTTFSFLTSNCYQRTSANVPLAISASGTPTITSTLNIVSTGTILDLNVVNLAGLHTYMSDLTFSLKSPANTTVTLFSGICTSTDNFNLNLDDEAAAGAIPCPPTTGLYYRPSNPLTAFDGQATAGTWTLTVVDGADLDGGSLDSWALEICAASGVGISEYMVSSPAYIYPNPTSGLLSIKTSSLEVDGVDCKIVNGIGQEVFSKHINASTVVNADLSALANGIYFVTLTGKSSVSTQKVVLNK